MVAGVFAELASSTRGRGSPSASTTTSPARSLRYDPTLDIEPADTVRAVFFGLGLRRHRRRQQEHHQDPRADPRTSTRRATSSTTRRSPGRRRCRTCGSGHEPIRAPYLVDARRLRRLPPVRPVLEQVDVLSWAAPGADAAAERAVPARAGVGRAAPPGAAADHRTRASSCTRSTPDASPARPAWAAGPTSCCRPASSRSPGCSPREEAIEKIKAAIRKTYARKGAAVVARNQAAVDAARRLCIGSRCRPNWSATAGGSAPVPAGAPEFVRTVTAEMMAGRGDLLPVSAMPVDGSYPSGTAQLREAEHLRHHRRCGTPTRASSAATARSSARTA